VQVELDAFLQAHADTDAARRLAIVRNGLNLNRSGIICLLLTNHSHAWCPNPLSACRGSFAMIDESTPMPDVIDGLRRADYAACCEFCRRQASDVLDPLIAGTARLGTIVLELEFQRPQELMAWKFPDRYEPFHNLPATVDAACEGRESDVYDLLADARFADLAATACAYLRDAAAQIKRYRQARD
jgi:hypothetical protein